MTIVATKTATLGELNVALVAAVGLVVPLSAQIDALISIGLGPFQADLTLQFNASLAAQATLSLQIGDPLQALKLAISALAQLQASLSAALTLPQISVSLSAELGASFALAGALSARLGLITLAIEAALQIKLGALNAIAAIQASLGAGPVVAVAFEGEDWATNAAKLETLLNGGTVDGFSIPGIAPTDPVAGGVLLATGSASAAVALSAIISLS